MSGTEDSELEKKKNQGEQQVKSIYISSMGFLTSTAKTVFWITLYFAIGAIVLYCSKIGHLHLNEQTTCIKPIPDESMNVFIHNKKSKNLKFDDTATNKKNIFLDMFRNYKSTKGQNNIVFYAIQIFEWIMIHNNKFFNFVFSSLGTYGSENAILILGPFVLGICAFLLWISNCGCIAVLSLYHLPVLFKKESEGTFTWPSEFKDKIWSFMFGVLNLGLVGFIMFWLIILTFGGAGIIFGFVPLLILTSIMGLATHTSKFKTTPDNYDDKVSIGSFIIETFKFFKVPIMIVLSIIITMNALLNLGVLAGIFALFVILLIAYDFINIGLFQKIDIGYIEDISTIISETSPTTNVPICPDPVSTIAGGSKKKVNGHSKGYLEKFMDDVSGKTHKDLMRQIHRLSTLSTF